MLEMDRIYDSVYCKTPIDFIELIDEQKIREICVIYFCVKKLVSTNTGI